MLVGLRRILAEEGLDVVGQEQVVDRILGEAARLQPDVIVLDLDSARGGMLAVAVRRAAPRAKLIFWARDETLMEVLDPGSSASRLVVTEDPDGLRRELVASHQVKE